MDRDGPVSSCRRIPDIYNQVSRFVAYVANVTLMNRAAQLLLPLFVMPYRLRIKRVQRTFILQLIIIRQNNYSMNLFGMIIFDTPGTYRDTRVEENVLLLSCNATFSPAGLRIQPRLSLPSNGPAFRSH